MISDSDLNKEYWTRLTNNMISASRSYQTNTEVMNTAKNMLMHTLQIGS